MNCPRCGKTVGANAMFCMHCGQGLAGPQQGARQSQQPMPNPGNPAMAAPMFASSTPSGKKTTWIAITTALAIVLAIVIGLKAAGVLKIGAQSPKLASLDAEGQAANQRALQANGQVPQNDLLKADGSTPQQESLKAEGQSPEVPLMRADGQVGPNTLDRTDMRVMMPDDVRRWLEHLERIEKRKNDLSLKQLADMTVLMQRMKVLGGMSSLLGGDDEEDTPPTKEAEQEFNDLQPEWNQLISDFRSYPPPAECKPIADDYSRALLEVPGVTSDIANILTNAMDNPQEALQRAYKLQNTSQNVIDKYFRESDNKVGNICSKYNTSKWFSIKSDVGGGLMSKFGI
ncbi:MAG: zinc ribbon domain-containing protein [Armatimonadetes bacterium]|nr:zinc ribbon domain-containing protein [Armatimonadota bacterium]